jgi:hypothetical protein
LPLVQRFVAAHFIRCSVFWADLIMRLAGAAPQQDAWQSVLARRPKEATALEFLARTFNLET